jgi:hypothetical protein
MEYAVVATDGQYATLQVEGAELAVSYPWSDG